MNALRGRRGSGAAVLLVSTLFLLLGAGGARAEEEGEAEWTKDAPFSFTLDYAAVSDYIFRGINFSEYPGEGREKLNHQLGTGVALETPAGTFGAAGWFEWYSGQTRIVPEAGNNLQEIDYTLSWGYTLADIATSVELGWISYTFPHLSGDAFATYEVYARVELDDSIIFGTPVLKPFVYYGLDYDLGNDGSWIEVGGSHDFALGTLSDAPVLKDLTLTPSISVGFDYRYLHNFALAGTGGRSRKVANVTYGIAAAYNLSGAAGLPARYGSVSVGGFLSYSQAVRRDLLNDELYGGATVSYSW